MDVTIIICFYNAGEKLIPTIEHIGKLQTKDLDVELVLVDNASTDNSTDIIRSNADFQNQIPWKIVAEPRPGLANARLKGLATAKGKYLLFCDDDNWLNSDYLYRGADILESNNAIAALGGLGTPVSSIQIPAWFEEVQNMYAVGPQFHSNGEVKVSRNMVYGAGMFIRKSAFQEILKNGFQYLSLGRTGKSLSSGEDSEMCLALRIAGYKIWYDNTLRFSHYIDSERLTLDYLKKLKLGMSNSGFISRFYRDYLLKQHRPNVNWSFWIRELIHVSRQLLSEFFNRTAQSDDMTDRNIRLMKFILSDPIDYNRKVKWVLETCNRLESNGMNRSSSTEIN